MDHSQARFSYNATFETQDLYNATFGLPAAHPNSAKLYNATFDSEIASLNSLYDPSYCEPVAD
jgi:hypothetical protein